ncbi:Co2+/Mg2+ efflux protein ApaG [Ferrimonas marina]|uniref:ApaG protein n=1 Tax=Ferrimonas marina TaxID=299255 RepID=A0A1M5ZL00_9GAMM|nr:Co2+/Mg2+ efflux protein ApaG [Ferrimonas marina]SHI24831.1 ApaG protein [Ferrimonas marina]
MANDPTALSPLHIEVATQYAPEHSEPAKGVYLFLYTITLRNHGDDTLKLERRHWFITDGNGERSEVEGPGVVGETPTLSPGTQYRYTSSVTLPTPVGTMQGFYTLSCNGQEVRAPIAPFSLSQPGTLH